MYTLNKLLQAIWPYLVSESTPLSAGERVRSSLSAFVALLLVGYISKHFIHGAGLLVLVASMGASAVLLFATPHSPLTQPWPLVGGNLIAAFVGVTCAQAIADPWVASATAVSLAILAMHLTHSLHPPGGAVALVAVLGGQAIHAKAYHFLLEPVGLNVLV